MLKHSIILSAFFIISLFAACPHYPYSPRNGVWSGADWEYFCDDWKLAQPGNGVISFKALGNDIYVGLFDNPNAKTFKYAVIIAGWGNSQIHLYSNGNINTALAQSNFNVPNTDIPNSYSLSFNQTEKSIKVLFAGNVVFSYVDSNYLNQANAQFISFSQSGSNVVLYQDCPTYPYQPRNSVWNGGYWEYFCSDWKLSQPAEGSISFAATGNDMYVGLFDTVNSKTFKYAIIFAGWSNSQIHLYKNGDFNNAISSVNFNVPVTDVPNAYKFVFSQSSKTITVYFNGQLAFNFVDSNYVTQTAGAQFISIAQSGSNVVLYQNCPTYPYNARNGVFSGAYWEYFCKNWQLPENGTGILSFQAKGNDFYVGLFDNINTKAFKYAIIFAGWGNSQLGLYKNGDSSTQFLNVKLNVPDVNVYNNYSIGFSSNKSTIAAYMNGKLIFAYGDTTWYAPNARWISLSQAGTNVWFQNITVDTVCGVNKSFMQYYKHVDMFAQIEGKCPVERGSTNVETLLVQNKFNKRI